MRQRGVSVFTLITLTVPTL